MKEIAQPTNVSNTRTSDIAIGEKAVLDILRVADMLIRIGNSKVFRKTLTQAQFNILMVLKRHGQQGMSQKDILGNLVSTKGNISIHIGNLEKKGFIRRKTSKQDARRHVITLTAKGKGILELNHRIMAKKLALTPGP